MVFVDQTRMEMKKWVETGNVCEWCTAALQRVLRPWNTHTHIHTRKLQIKVYRKHFKSSRPGCLANSGNLHITDIHWDTLGRRKKKWWLTADHSTYIFHKKWVGNERGKQPTDPRIWNFNPFNTVGLNGLRILKSVTVALHSQMQGHDRN